MVKNFKSMNEIEKLKYLRVRKKVKSELIRLQNLKIENIKVQNFYNAANCRDEQRSLVEKNIYYLKNEHDRVCENQKIDNGFSNFSGIINIIINDK